MVLERSLLDVLAVHMDPIQSTNFMIRRNAIQLFHPFYLLRVVNTIYSRSWCECMKVVNRALWDSIDFLRPSVALACSKKSVIGQGWLLAS